MNGREAMQEQSSVTRINNLLEEVDKEIYSLEHDIQEINQRLLTPDPNMESEKINKDSKNKMINEGWFIQTITKLESLRNHLRKINREKIQELKKATGLLEPESKDLRGGENGP